LLKKKGTKNASNCEKYTISIQDAVYGGRTEETTIWHKVNEGMRK
jgi:hypothetical protein